MAAGKSQGVKPPDEELSDSMPESEDSDDVPDLEDANDESGQRNEGSDTVGRFPNEEDLKNRSPNRSEKKARKMILKLGLKQVTGVHTVTIKKSASVFFIIDKPEVYRASADSYVIFGEARVEDANSRAQLAAAEQFKTTRDNRNMFTAQIPIEAEPSVEIDSTGVDEKDIELVINQANVPRHMAIKALKTNDNDIVHAIMSLTM